MSAIKSNDKKILICDDHPIVREGMHNILHTAFPDIQIDEASNGKKVLEMVAQQLYDLIILDLSMEEMDGMTFLAKYKEYKKKGKVLVVTMHKDVRYIRRCIQLGVSGYILKDDGTEEILSGVRELLNDGDKYYSRTLVPYLAQDFTLLEHRSDFLQKLTEREKEVLYLLIDGLTSKEIGNQIGISGRTVDHYRAQILNKAGVRNSVDLINFCRDLGIDPVI